MLGSVYACSYDDEWYFGSAANRYHSSASHHEQKNNKTTDQIKFLAVTIKQWIELV